jgi:hypothetical protein
LVTVSKTTHVADRLQRFLQHPLLLSLVSLVSVIALFVSIYSCYDAHRARLETRGLARTAQHPYIGVDDVYVDPDNRVEIVGGPSGEGTITTPGNIYALLRAYGSSPALVTAYKIDCLSGEYEGGEESFPNLTLLPGATKTFTCSPNIHPGPFRMDDAKNGLILNLTKPIQIRLTFELEDIFHGKESKTFCFSNRPNWDRKHLRSCEERHPLGAQGK